MEYIGHIVIQGSRIIYNGMLLINRIKVFIPFPFYVYQFIVYQMRCYPFFEIVQHFRAIAML